MIYQKGHLARPLDSLFSSPSRLAALRALHLAPEGLTGRWVARRAGISPQAALNALDGLASLHLVTKQESGRSLIWFVARKHWLNARLLGPLFASEKELAPLLADQLKKELKGLVEQALLVGPLAAGKFAPGEQFTMVLVCEPAKRRRLAEGVKVLRAELWNSHGLVLGAVVLSANEAARRPGIGDAWRLLPDEGRGFLYGTRTSSQRK